MRRDVPSDDGVGFANPFTPSDRRALDTFLEDGEGYERVENVDESDAGGAPADDGPAGGGRRRRGGGPRRDETYGDVLPGVLGTDRASGPKAVYLVIFLVLCLYLAGYYGMSRRAGEREHAAAAAADLGRPGDRGADLDADDRLGGYGGGRGDDEVGPSLVYDDDDYSKPPPPLAMQRAPAPSLFDPFRMRPRIGALSFGEENDWFGSPFAPYPPSLAGSGGGSRLGYAQNPDAVGGTVVFSSEGDIYLTRIDAVSADVGITQPPPAARLTTTVGNALHPRLNPALPHLLAYSATYSGVREVYLLDLRPGSSGGDGDGAGGAPGGPGGPALRLTYTPGGIRSVVGWADGGRSVLYSARGGDGDALPDVRMYRLRLSWDDGDGEESKGGDEQSNREEGAESPREDPHDEDESDFSIDGARSYVDEVTSVPGAIGDEGPPDGAADREDGGGDSGDRRRERQRRHLAERLRERQARRGAARPAVRSTVEPVPLAQAVEGSYYTPDSSDASSGPTCLYFTRYAQSSSTKRYVGGTAPSIWSHCGDDGAATPLTSDYNGTSRHPIVGGLWGDALYFLSDRERVPAGEDGDGGGWVAGGMDLWAVSLPLPPGGIVSPVRLTRVSCWSGGLDISEYTVDPSTGDAVLRVGADLHLVSGAAIRGRLAWGEENALPEASFPLPEVKPLNVAVRSDFGYMHERVIPMSVSEHLTSVDAYRTSYGSVSALVTARGQTFVAPVVKEKRTGGRDRYGGGGSNMPERKYKVAPGHGGGGLTRILTSRHVPLPPPPPGKLDSGERLALLLATDPLSATGEHAFYLVRTDASSVPAFGFASLYEYETDVEGTGGLPRPFLGGHLETGGAVRDGGLGSVHADTVAVSPCGRRFAFADTDGRIVAATIPSDGEGADVDVVVLPAENENGQPMVGDGETELVWSPGGRYLAVGHRARNQFGVISIADLGVPEGGSMTPGRIVPATVDRFNSMSPVWGRAGKDVLVDGASDALPAMSANSTDGATVLYFLSDRDIASDGPGSPWGTRAPQPSFDDEVSVHALPLRTVEDALEDNPMNAFVSAPYGGGGALEVAMEGVNELELLLEAEELAKGLLSGAGDPTGANGTDAPDEDEEDDESPFVVDTVISLGVAGDDGLAFARSSYRLDHIPSGNYVKIVTQVDNDPSLVLLEDDDGPGMYSLSLFAVGDWPSDSTEEVRTAPGLSVQYADTSGDGRYMIAVVDGNVHVVETKAEEIAKFFSDEKLEGNRADVGGLSLSVWPQLEHQQMFRDAWRMLRDYFYDPDLHKVDWEGMFDRYLPLVKRCAKREELDDVLRQLVGELSALHSFVYGGEYPSPNHGDGQLESINEIATLGAVLRRSEEMRGLEVVKIPLRDADLHHTDGEARYSPLSHQALRNTGQRGLEAGDVILAVNGQNVLDAGHIGSLLRNTAGRSVRLDVLRIASTSRLRRLRDMKRRAEGDNETAAGEEEAGLVPEPLIVVPITPGQGDDLDYAAWEWKTRLLAKSLARDAGFGCGYLHLRDMSGAPSINAFARDFYSDYDKEAFIIDVRNNRGGNIDSWLLDVLQRKAWMFWQGRSSNITTGGLGWDQQFAFRGHLVVLVNEHTSSDGEGFARGVSELGLGVIIGKRTWGGGIWLSSDNTLVDGGIATAAEIGTYNKNFGWGLGIEQMGVIPDVEVDNDPRMAFEGKDTQLDRAVSYLKDWIEREPITLPESPGPHRDMSKPKSSEECH